MPAPVKQPAQESRLSTDIALLIEEQSASPGTGKAAHTHPEGQLYISLRGLIVVEAAGSRMIMPPGHLCWIPPGISHGASIHGNQQVQSKPVMAGLTLFLAPELCTTLPALPVNLRSNEMLNVLLERMRCWPARVGLDEAQRRMLLVFIDELNRATPESLNLVMPRHTRLQKMASHMAAQPEDQTSLDEWAAQLAMSRRSISRHFRSETGMSILEWKQVARLQRGMELLTAGAAVTTVALTLGYDSVSSFISLFRRMTGSTPAQFKTRINTMNTDNKIKREMSLD